MPRHFDVKQRSSNKISTTPELRLLWCPRTERSLSYCYLDPEHLPEAIMVQIHTDSWEHRAVWGNQNSIPFGKLGTESKRRIGDLPEAGKWVRLEFTAQRVGLKPDDKVTGYAFTQFGGTVTGTIWESNRSLTRRTIRRGRGKFGKRLLPERMFADLPDDLRNVVRGKQPDQWTEKQYDRIRSHWLRNIYSESQEELADLTVQRSKIENEKAELEKTVPVTFVMADLPTPRTSHVMNRGQYDNPGEQVTRNVPAFLPPLPAQR